MMYDLETVAWTKRQEAKLKMINFSLGMKQLETGTSGFGHKVEAAKPRWFIAEEG